MSAQDASFFLRKRYFVCFLTFLGTMMLFMLRGDLSIAIVDMTSVKNITSGNTTYLKVSMPKNKSYISSIIASSRDCQWLHTRTFFLSFLVVDIFEKLFKKNIFKVNGILGTYMFFLTKKLLKISI